VSLGLSAAEIAARRWFAQLGGPQLAYVRPDPSGEFWELRGADGALIGLFRNREIALCGARRHGYEPVTAH
jgi:hypothetical protein